MHDREKTTQESASATDSPAEAKSCVVQTYDMS